MNAEARQPVEQRLAEEIPPRTQSRQTLYTLVGRMFAWSLVVAALFAGYLISLFFFGEAYFYHILDGPDGEVIVMSRQYKYRTVAQLYIPAAWTIGRATGSPVHLSIEGDPTFYFNSHDE